MKPNLVPMFAALALLCGVTTSLGADEEFVGKDEPTLPELKSPEHLRVAIVKRLDAVDQKLDTMLDKRDVPPELAREVKLQFKQGAKLLRDNLITQKVKKAPPKKSRKSTQRHKHNRPTPVEAGRAPIPHPPGS